MNLQYLAINLWEFKNIDSVPMNISLDRLDEGQEVAKTLLLHKQVYHKAWYLKFAYDKLKGVQKRVLDDNQVQRKQERVLLHQHKNQNVSFVVSWVGRCTEQVLNILIAMLENVQQKLHAIPPR